MYLIFVVLFVGFLCRQRQQVILTEAWGSQHKEIHFSCMHPGWADTPGMLKLGFFSVHLWNFPKLAKTLIFLPLAVKTSMPSFHEKMQTKLRTEVMGADTIVWLAVSAAAIKQPSGLFFQG